MKLTLLSGRGHQHRRAGDGAAAAFRGRRAESPRARPIPNLPVRFDVMRGTGTLADAAGEPGPPVARTSMLTRRTRTVRGAGVVHARQAERTGRQHGESELHAAHGRSHFVATTQRGVVAKVLADTGINQFAETGSQRSRSCRWSCAIAKTIRCANIPVVFSVEEGDAFFSRSGGRTSRRSC